MATLSEELLKQKAVAAERWAAERDGNVRGFAAHWGEIETTALIRAKQAVDREAGRAAKPATPAETAAEAEARRTSETKAAAG